MATMTQAKQRQIMKQKALDPRVSEAQARAETQQQIAKAMAASNNTMTKKKVEDAIAPATQTAAAVPATTNTPAKTTASVPATNTAATTPVYNTKNNTAIDYTNQPQATTQADVDAQDSRTRLWQSLNYSYGNQIRESDKSYDQAYSQADRQALSRGMQRSSYNAQTLANLNNQKIEAQNNIRAAQIADYQNRISQLEQQEAENERWEREFAANQEQNAWSRGFQEAEAAREQGNWEIQQAFNEKQWQAQQDQWKQEFEYSKMSTDQKLAYETIMTIIGQGNDPSDDLLARAGLSRADVNAMKAQAVTSSGGKGGSTPGTTNPGTTNPTTNPSTTFLDGLNNFQTGATTGNKTSQTTSASKNDAVTVKTNGVSKNVRSLNQLLVKKPVIDERK